MRQAEVQGQHLENIKEAEDEQQLENQKSSPLVEDGDNTNQQEFSPDFPGDNKGENNKGSDLYDKNDTSGPECIEYERLSEFFFDLCLSWCQHLDIETYIFFLNGIFLNITTGSHVNVSIFREIDDIEVLSVEFFNKLLSYRNRCEENLQQGQTYAEWYAENFGRSHPIAASVQKNL